MEKIIGITFGVPDSPISMFSNGIRQNVLYFSEVLSLIGYDVYLILDKKLIDNIFGFDYDKYKYIIHDDPNIDNIDFKIVFQMGLTIPFDLLKKLKEKGCKLISYKCGNDYIFDMEHVLFSSKPTNWPQHADFSNKQYFDQTWSIPQMENTNFYYWKTLYRCPVLVVPFIWSPKAIETACSISKIDGLYKKKGDEKSIAIFEPNINIFKYALPAVLVCENAYRNISHEKINKVYITNALKPKEENKNKYGNFDYLQFSRMTYSLNLYIDKKLSVENRHQTIYFMSKYADIAVSHQWENPLNYLYLDLAWMGWPILHNAHLCKDVGYYYEGFNYEEGGKVLEDIIKNHDNNVEEYTRRNRKIIERYLPENVELQNVYRKLIEDVLNI
jgi:hypothetical protein